MCLVDLDVSDPSSKRLLPTIRITAIAPIIDRNRIKNCS